MPLLPIMGVVPILFLVATGLNLWFARHESSLLLKFFVGHYHNERVA